MSESLRLQSILFNGNEAQTVKIFNSWLQFPKFGKNICDIGMTWRENILNTTNANTHAWRQMKECHRTWLYLPKIWGH